MPPVSLPSAFVSALGSPSAAPEFGPLDPVAGAVAVLALLLATLAALIRRSIAQSTPEGVLEPLPPGPERTRLEQLLARSDRLTTSAAVLETGFALLYAVAIVRLVAGGNSITWSASLQGLALSIPALWFLTDALPRSIALHSGDRIVRRWLPFFRTVQWPLGALTRLLEAVRRGLLRLLGLHDDPESTRRIVAGLREVIEDAEISGRLDESEKEMIGNVMELRDVDAAALMTPRTRVVAADFDEGLPAAAKILAESGHSRLPVYQGTIDRIMGTITARDIVAAIAAGPLEQTEFKSVLHAPMLVPETTRVRELLGEMRRQRTELAIVVDEYGGTAGIITIGDVVTELIGEVPDEYDEDAPEPVRQLADGAWEFDAGLHVSEVNERVDLDLPEEADFETLGGFVLAELGRFPVRGESFRRGSAEFTVVDSSDRRVLKVRIRQLAQAEAG